MGCGNINNFNLLNAKVNFSSHSPIQGNTLNFTNIETMFFQICGYDTNNPEKNSDVNIIFTKNIKVLSNRVYTVWLSFFDNDNFFSKYNNQNTNDNIVRLNPVIIGNSDNNITIINESYYKQPIITTIGEDTIKRTFFDNNQPDLIEQEYNGSWGYNITEVDESYGGVTIDETTGSGVWRRLKCEFKINDNSEYVVVKLGVNIKTTYPNGFNLGQHLFFSNFAYEAADTLTQDPTKQQGIIESNFGNSFMGGIQKLRIYDRALTSQETLHNAVIESRLNPTITASKGGRIINIITPKVVIPKPEPVVVRGVIIFYGSSSIQPIPSQTLVDETTTNKLFVSDVVADNIITLNFGDNIGKYLWFALPSSYTSKTIWEVRGVYKLRGGIGENSDLFVIESDIPLNSVDYDFHNVDYSFDNLNYDFYITQYPTDTSLSNEFNFKP